jgi:hypothetical protein
MREGRNRLLGLGATLVIATAMAVTPAMVAEAQQPKMTAAEEAKVKQQAIEAFKTGNTAFKAGNYEEAYTNFKKADDLYPGAKPKFMVAQSLDKLGRSAEAVAAYRAFIDSNPCDSYREELAEAGKRVAALEASLPGQITIKVAPEAAAGIATIVVDDNPVTGTEVELPAGEHTIVISAEGYETVTERITVKPNEQRELAIALVPASAPVPTPVPLPEPVEGDDEGPSNIPAYVTLGIAGAGVVLGVVFGVQALSAKSDFDENPTVDNADKAERNALIADMSFGVALTFGITGAVLLISNMASGDDEPDTSEEVTFVPQVTPMAGTQGGGVAATWTF